MERLRPIVARFHGRVEYVRHKTRIRRATRRQYAAEERTPTVLEGLRGEDHFAESFRRKKINQNLYYRWLKEFLEVGKKRFELDCQVCQQKTKIGENHESR